MAGCGAAIRVAPVGMLYSSRRLHEIFAGAKEASISTRGTPLALAAAAATAAAVSGALDGAASHEIVELAQSAADRAEHERSGSNDSVFAKAIRTTYVDLCERWPLQPADVASTYFPNDPLTIVPLAIAIAAVMESADAAILLATNVGGDSDSVASIAGAILGARYPDTVNDGWYKIVEMVNRHDLITLGEALSGIRR